MKIEEFTKEHNHDLVHKKDKHYVTSNCKLKFPLKQALHKLANINICPN